MRNIVIKRQNDRVLVTGDFDSLSELTNFYLPIYKKHKDIMALVPIFHPGDKSEITIYPRGVKSKDKLDKIITCLKPFLPKETKAEPPQTIPATDTSSESKVEESSSYKQSMRQMAPPKTADSKAESSSLNSNQQESSVAPRQTNPVGLDALILLSDTAAKSTRAKAPEYDKAQSSLPKSNNRFKPY